jgi:dolichyl-phosphate beta-glucosyltransferase
MYISIIIPAYNEEKRLPKTLASVLEYMSRQNYEWEVVVVDDGSTDGTVSIVKDFISNNSKIKLIENKENHGKGYVVKKGMLASLGERRLFMDADGSTPISEIDKLNLYMDQGYDVAIGSRRVAGSDVKEDQPLHRIFLGWLFRELVDFILPLGVVDSQNGFKMFSGKSAEVLFSRQSVNGWAFDVEILYLARRLGYKVIEVPIVWVNDKETKVTLRSMMKMIWEVVRVRVG